MNRYFIRKKNNKKLLHVQIHNNIPTSRCTHIVRLDIHCGLSFIDEQLLVRNRRVDKEEENF